MESIICFFCDIQGTICGKLKNSPHDYEKLNELLLHLKEKNNVDYIMFSLFSSDNYESVEQQKRELEKYLEFPIILGKQFFESGYIEDKKVIRIHTKQYDTKIDQIIGCLNELKRDYIIDKVYYVDDSSLLHEILEITQEYSLNEITSIIPKMKNGLSEVNQLLEEKINIDKKIFVKKNN